MSTPMHHTDAAHLDAPEHPVVGHAIPGVDTMPVAPTILVDMDDQVAAVVFRALCAYLADQTTVWEPAVREAVTSLAAFIHHQLDPNLRTAVPQFPPAGVTREAA